MTQRMSAERTQVPALVYYSLIMQQRPADQQRLAQLLHSLTSLRSYNPRIPVYLHLFGELDPLFCHFLHTQLKIFIVRFGDFGNFVERIYPGSGDYLKAHPILHKYLSMVDFLTLKPAQALYVDTDTLFYADPAILLGQCRESDIYAREEPRTVQCAFYDPYYLDDQDYRELGAQLGSRYVTPFNTGVLVLNHAVWERLMPHHRTLVEYALRFALSTEKDDPAKIEALALATGLSPLRYPCSNVWIRDQMALWLSLGKLEPFSLGLLKEEQLLQGAVEIQAPGQYARPLLTHYFSTECYGFFKALPGNPYRQSNA